MKRQGNFIEILTLQKGNLANMPVNCSSEIEINLIIVK
jgi:hypothetical protein